MSTRETKTRTLAASIKGILARVGRGVKPAVIALGAACAMLAAPVASGGVAITFLICYDYEITGLVQQDFTHFNVTQGGRYQFYPSMTVSSTDHFFKTDTLGPAYFDSDIKVDHVITITPTSSTFEVISNTLVHASVALGWPQGAAEGDAIIGRENIDFTVTSHTYHYTGSTVLSKVGTTATFPSGSVLTPGLYYVSGVSPGGGSLVKAQNGESNTASNSGKLRYRFVRCGADFNGDGFVTGDDFDLYSLAFVAGADSADFDGDGFVTGDDFDAYSDAFQAGC